MPTRTAAILIAGLLLTAGLPAQETGQESQLPATKPRSDTVGQPTNIKLEVTITDQTGPGEPGRKTVSMILADRQSGSIRSGGHVLADGNRLPVTLNVDARPVIVSGGRILVELTLEYLPKPGTDNASSGEGRANLTERLSGLIVASGKPLVISQASDPSSDRRISVELTATIQQ